MCISPLISSPLTNIPQLSTHLSLLASLKTIPRDLDFSAVRLCSLRPLLDQESLGVRLRLVVRCKELEVVEARDETDVG